jgi:uncharacterized membrane protein
LNFYNKGSFSIEEASVTTTVPSRTPAAIDNPAYQAFLALRIGFVVAPILFGLDKFTNLLADWTTYLAPAIDRLVPGSATSAMLAVGVVEVVAGRELWHAGTYIFIAGAAMSVLAALTGLWDAWKSSEAGTQARRTINTHATIMVTVTVLALADIAWRLNDYHTEAATPVGIAVLSVVIGLLVSVGATFGGSLVYDYGFNVETAGDHPVWHKSETDVFPGQHD